MARVTVEDCIDKVTNRFELILLASHRSRQISAGGRISVERDNDKNPVVALREIAEEQLSPEDLKEDLIHSLQKHVEVDEPEDQMDAENQEALMGGILPEVAKEEPMKPPDETINEIINEITNETTNEAPDGIHNTTHDTRCRDKRK